MIVNTTNWASPSLLSLWGSPPLRSNRLERLLVRLLRGIEKACGLLAMAAADESQGDILVTCDADIRLAKSGDHEAYRRLVERHQQEIGRFLWKFTQDKNAWDELLQTVFVEGFLSLRSYRGDSDFVDWLRGIATHVGYRFWNAKQKQKARVQPLKEQQAHSVTAVARRELGLFEMLELLPPRDRLVLTLLYVEERSVAETAKLAGWTESTVKSQAFRARIKLKELWERDNAG